MVKNLRAYFILCVTAIEWKMCVQQKIELSSMSQRPRLRSTNITRDLSLATEI